MEILKILPRMSQTLTNTFYVYVFIMYMYMYYVYVVGFGMNTCIFTKSRRRVFDMVC